jgi:hypothetical protein
MAVTDVPHTVGLAGKQPVSFLLYDNGLTQHGDSVVVTNEFLAANRPLLGPGCLCRGRSPPSECALPGAPKNAAISCDHCLPQPGGIKIKP